MALSDIFAAFRSGNKPEPVQITLIDPSKNNATVPGSEARSDGSVAAIPKAGEGEASPLENYKDLWQIDPKAPPAPNGKVTIPADPVKMMEAARRVDFTKAVSPAILEKLKSGDSAAVMEAINAVGQAAFAQSAQATAAIVESALNKQTEHFHTKILPEALRRSEATSTLRADNPVFNSPAVAPLLALVESQMATKYPTASAAEVSQHARDFVLASSEAFLGASADKIVIPKPAAPTRQELARQDTDWSKFMGETD